MDPEISLYVSNQVKRNILKPILTKKRQFNNIICDNSSRGVVYFSENQIKVTSYLCRKSDTTLNIVVLLSHAPRSLKFFLPQEYSPKYFGIKNGKLKTYTEANLQKILKNYLL